MPPTAPPAALASEPAPALLGHAAAASPAARAATSSALATYVVFFDGHCRLCTESVGRLRRRRAVADVRFVDVQDVATLSAFPQVDPAAALGQMHVLTPAGRLVGGYDAVVALLPAYHRLGCLAPLLGLWPVRPVGRVVYRWVARNRYRIAGKTPAGVTHACADGACRIV